MKGKIILTFVLALVALSLIGLVGQSTLTQLIVSIKKESRPNHKLTTLKDILSDLTTAENSVRTYTITQETESLTPFYQSITTFDPKMQQFYALTKNKDQIKLADSIEVLIGKKYTVMKQLIDIKKDRSTNKVLQKVLDNIAKLRRPDSVPSLIDRDAQYYYSLNDDIIQKVEMPENNPGPRRKTLFQRIFGKNDEQEANEESKIITHNAPANSSIKKHTNVTDTSSAHNLNLPSTSNNDLNSQEIGSIINKIGKEENRNQQAVRQQELSLTLEDVALMQRIRTLADRFEQKEKINAQNRAEAAQQATDKAIKTITVTWIIALTTFAILLFIIFNDISRNQKNKEKLKEAKDKAEALAKVKEEFLSNMSHEIRTPLNSILGFTEQLEGSELDNTQSKYLSSIKHSGDHLLSLINDILDFTKLDAGKLNLESIGFKLSQCVDNVIETFKTDVRKKGLSIDAKLDPKLPEVLKGDPVRFEQILINLISNSIKFTDQGGITIELIADKLTEQEVRVKLIVKDTGIGIPKAKLHSVFKDFAQVDSSTTRKYGGTGLGLAIVKKLVKQHHGNVSLHSEEGKGTTFFITLNYEIGSKADLPEIVKKPKLSFDKLRGKKIMAVDDQEYNLELIKVIFEKWGIEGALINSGQQAVDEYKAKSFDLILMDVQMPEISGLEATQIIRKHERGRNQRTPIIALTAGSSTAECDECIDAGMNDYLLKPFTQTDLYNKLVEYLNQGGEVTNAPLENNTNDKSPELQNEKIIDFDDLYELGNGDPSFVVNMLEIFINNFTKDKADLENALETKDWNRIKSKAHKMIPPCRHLGLNVLVSILKEAETNADTDQNYNKIKGLIEETHKIYMQLKPIVEAEIQKLEQSEPNS